MGDIVVGIDQSLTESGIVVLMNNAALTSCVIKPGTRRGIVRLMHIENVLRSFIPSNAKLIVMEGYAFNPRAGQSFSLGELGGIVKRLAYTLQIPLISIAPGTLKKYVTGDGAAKKNVMLLGAFKKFGVSFTNDNECDAYCLARLGEEMLQADAGTITAAFKPIYKAVNKYNHNEDEGDTHA